MHVNKDEIARVALENVAHDNGVDINLDDDMASFALAVAGVALDQYEEEMES